MFNSIPPTALAHIREGERAARNGIERTKQTIQAVDASIRTVKLEAARCLATLQEESDDALAENTVTLARGIDKFKEQYDSLVEEKERLQGEKEQYGFQAALLLYGGKRCWDKLTNGHKWNKGSLLALIYGNRCIHNGAAWIEQLWIDRAVPASLVGDKDILLARLSHKEFHWPYYHYSGNAPVFSIPESLVSDKEVVASAVFRYPEILKQIPKHHQLFDEENIFFNYIGSRRENFMYAAGCDLLLSKFSARIRGNPSYMLKAAKITGRVFCCLEGELLDDQKFAQQLTESMQPGRNWSYSSYLGTVLPNDALKDFSDSVRSNPIVVRAFISKNGLCLQGASMELRGAEEIVRIACAQSAYAFFYCAPGPTKSRLLADKDFMRSVLSEVSSNVSSNLLDYYGIAVEEEDKFLYKMLPLDLQKDRDIICAAKLLGTLSMPTDLPDSLADDPAFWLEMIRKDSSFWLYLPRKFEDDDAFARGIENFKDEATVRAVFERFPALADDRTMWSTIIGSDDEDFPYCLDDVVEVCAPPSIRRNKELMMQALTRNGDVFRHLSFDLQEDRGFAESLVENFDEALTIMPHHTQRLYPDLVVASIRECEDREVSDLVDFVARELWINRAVCTKYLEEGGRNFSHFPEELKTDQSFGLFAAEVFAAQWLDYAYFEDLLPATLRSNKRFMMSAIRLNSNYFLCAEGILRRDVNLALLAFSCEENGQDTVKHYFSGDFDAAGAEDFAFLRRLWNEAKEKISAHEAFLAGILCGMSPYAGEGCPLNMLVQDRETTAALQDTAASMMGAPLGPELGMQRRVVKNLNKLFSQEELFFDESA